ncbi:MAG: alpha/beta fold hydrolase [Rhodoferax sp.]|nr:alpha/beta fold hydrolase [Rhodoferax sp.]
MRQPLDFATDGAHWPHREYSRFVQAAGLRWHVQFAPCADPAAPTVLLLHGTGASTHSWRDLVPLLQTQCAVLALDLPGHGFSAMPQGAAVAELCSLPGMARGVAAVLQTLGMAPSTVVGHSAGAALACRMALDGLLAPARLVSINGALLPLDGWAGQFFSPLAKLLAKAPLVPELFSWRAAQADVLQKLLDGTGSQLDSTGRDLYRKLISNPGHAGAALAMMAHWDLHTLARDLPALRTPLTMVVGAQDVIVPPQLAYRVAAALRQQSPQPVHVLAGLGHLAHEEQPEAVAALLLAPPSL